MIETRFVKGTIRRFGPNQWAALNDNTHCSEGIASVQAMPDHLVVNFSFTACRVVTGFAAPDETLAKIGIVAGPSIGLSSAMIYLGRTTGLVVPESISNANANIWLSFELLVDIPEVQP